MRIGFDTWMVENLNYQPQTGNSKCYKDSNSYCNKYGRLYDWNTAKQVCPAGWHLPRKQDWWMLERAVGSPTVTKLKSTTGWNNNANGTDDFGFSALPGGYAAAYRQEFYKVGDHGYWWTADQEFSESESPINPVSKEINIRYRNIQTDNFFGGTDLLTKTISGNERFQLLSVRCVQD
jgi:uncharacterized protein (TIGR02145 family)